MLRKIHFYSLARDGIICLRLSFTNERLAFGKKKCNSCYQFPTKSFKVVRGLIHISKISIIINLNELLEYH